MTKTLAIDIILLPPENIMDAAIDLNDKLLSNQKTPLDKKEFLPHISLLMGAIEQSRLDELTTLLQQIAEGTLPLELSAHFENREFSMFMIEPSSALQALHETILKQTKNLVDNDINEDNLFDHNVDKRWIDYMSDFRTNSSQEHFDPHITIGRGRLEGFHKSITFETVKIAVGRLGDRCTVRKVLFKTPEKSNS